MTNASLVTPIDLYVPCNDQSGFTVGQINTNYNQFTSYLALFTMTPANWASTVNGALLFQLRIKFSDTPYPQFRVLLAPTLASAA